MQFHPLNTTLFGNISTTASFAVSSSYITGLVPSASKVLYPTGIQGPPGTSGGNVYLLSSSLLVCVGTTTTTTTSTTTSTTSTTTTTTTAPTTTTTTTSAPTTTTTTQAPTCGNGCWSNSDCASGCYCIGNICTQGIYCLDGDGGAGCLFYSGYTNCTQVNGTLCDPNATTTTTTGGGGGCPGGYCTFAQDCQSGYQCISGCCQQQEF